MMGGVPADWFMRKKLLKLTADLGHIPPEIWGRACVRCFNEKDDPRALCADYRAAATIDCDLDTADLDRKLQVPILVLWGTTSSVGKRFADPLGLWRQRANDVRGEALPSGHYVNEEAPEQVLDWFLVLRTIEVGFCRGLSLIPGHQQFKSWISCRGGSGPPIGSQRARCRVARR